MRARAWQPFGYGRYGWSAKLTHGLTAETRTGLQPWRSRLVTEPPSPLECSCPDIQDAPNGAIRRAVGNRPNPALIISRPSVRLFSTLFVYPDVFETPAVEQAVHHDCEPLNPWLPAHCKTAIKDDRLDVVLGQFPFDFPYQLLAFIGIGLR